MADYNEQFIPEEINEQIRRFSSASPHSPQAGADPNHRLIQDLRRIYRDNDTEADTHSLQRSWQRIVSAQKRSGHHVQTAFTDRKVFLMNTFTKEAGKASPQRPFGQRFGMLVAAVVALFLVGSMVVTFTLMRGHQTAQTTTTNTLTGAPGSSSTGTQMATTQAIATATAQANTILEDPLTDHIHNWPLANGGPLQYKFENGAYHIIVNDKDHLAVPLLPGETFNGPMAYTVTMQEVRGDDTSPDNWFGIVMRFSLHQQNGRTIQTFYCFDYEPADGIYQFRMYNNGLTGGASAWSDIWHMQRGKEYHTGHGARNTIKVFAKGNDFTFFINGKRVGEARDNSLTSGQIGMVVNQQGAEVAFSDLILTYN